MSITQQLQAILQARYGRDVRQAIHDSIEDGYNIAVQAEGKATTAQDSASASASAAAQSSTIALQSAQLAEQYKNEAFSGTPTGYEALVEKVNSIYKETASQYAIVGSSEGSALAHTIYGMSKQDGVPTPDSPVEIQSSVANFKCVGKNLVPLASHLQVGVPVTISGVTYVLHEDGHYTVTGKNTSTSTVWYSFLRQSDNLKLPKSGNYSIYCKVVDRKGTTDENTNISFLFYDPNLANPIFRVWNKDSQWNTATSRYSATNDTSFVLSHRVAPNVEVDVDYYPILMMGSNDENEPVYIPPQLTAVTTDLTLRALEVTSSDDYNLTKGGKYYIADTVDWSEDRGYEITRRIGKRDITTMINVGSSPKYGIVERTSFNYEDFVVPSDDSKRALLACNRFIVGRFYNYMRNDGIISFNSDNKYLYLRNDAMKSLADWNTWIANNHVEVYGVLKTPTTEHITSEQAQALLSLKTFDGGTSIMVKPNEVAPVIDLEYSKDRNTALALTGHNIAHKNALKLNDLNNALLEAMAQ